MFRMRVPHAEIFDIIHANDDRKFYPDAVFEIFSSDDIFIKFYLFYLFYT